MKAIKETLHNFLVRRTLLEEGKIDSSVEGKGLFVVFKRNGEVYQLSYFYTTGYKLELMTPYWDHSGNKGWASVKEVQLSSLIRKDYHPFLVRAKQRIV